MQPKNKNDSVQLPTRYQQYDFAKQYLRGRSRPLSRFPIGFVSRKSKMEKHDSASPKGRSQGERVYDPAGIAPASGGFPSLRVVRRSFVSRRAKRKSTTVPPREDDISNCITAAQSREHLVLTPCIRANHHNTADVHFVGSLPKVRRLTPTECERLQSFPDGWTDGISDSQRYKCLGNAVTVNVVRAIINKLLPDIEENREAL